MMHSAILTKLASTAIKLTIQESFSGKVTIPESSLWETGKRYQGIVFPGNVSSGKKLSGKRLSTKMTIGESYYQGETTVSRI